MIATMTKEVAVLTRAVFARFIVSGRGLEGRWEPCTCVHADQVLAEHEVPHARCVRSSLTDMDGEFGPACNFTEWGVPGADRPLIANLVLYENRTPVGCFHMVPVPEADVEPEDSDACRTEGACYFCGLSPQDRTCG